MQDQIDRMAKQVDDLHRHVLDPNNGMAVRLAKVETQQAWFKRALITLASVAGLGGVVTKLFDG